jgi:hypothetical protein
VSKHEIAHTCGCVRDYRLYGPHKDRDRKAAWLSQQPCPICRAGERGPTAYVRHVEHDGSAVMDVAVVDCYEHRDVLRRRHYAYTDHILTGESFNALLDKPRRGWRAHLKGTVAEVRHALIIEVAWLAQQGWTVKPVDPITSMVLGAAGEGRAEALP